MKFLSNIVDHINCEIVNLVFAKSPVFARNALYGIADHLPILMDSEKTSVPFIVDANGEGRYVGPDDINDVAIYHVLDSIRTAKTPASFGDAISRTYTIQMGLICFVNRSVVGFSSDELGVILATTFETVQNRDLGEKMQSKSGVTISTSQIVTNSASIFSSEFKGLSYFLKPEFYLLRIVYSVEFEIQNNCYSICD